MILEHLNKSENKIIFTKGILCSLLGIASIVLSNASFTLVAYFFGGIALANGLITLLAIIYSRIAIRNFSIFHYEGLTSFIVGALILGFPQMAVNVFMSILGVAIMGMGLIQIALAFDLQTYRVKEDLLIYSGILSVILGMIVFRNPEAISTFINLILGIFFATAGGYTVYFAYKALQKQAAGRKPKEVSQIHLQPHVTYQAQPVMKPIVSSDATDSGIHVPRAS